MKLHHLLIAVMLVAAQASVAQADKPTHPELRHIIDSLFREDQAGQLVKPNDSAVAVYQRAIHAHYPEVVRILDTYGFPGYDMVGKEGMDEYFTLVQHTDFDVLFQKKALALMKPQVEKKNASGQAYAYLTDRVELNEGRQQIYGTQVNMSAHTTIRPCIDPKNLDKRRKSVGLGPIKEYLERCNEVFFQLNPHEKK